MNMSRFSNIILTVAAVLMAAACTDNARIDGVMTDAPSSEVIVKLLDVNVYEVLDTVRTDDSGRFSYKVSVEKGQPEFVYVFYKDTKVASLLLEAGDAVSVKADTLGNYSVEGSEESARLAQVEKDYVTALARLDDLAVKMNAASEKDAAELRYKLGQEYVSYYRSRVRYIMENSRSLTVVPVFFQNFGPQLPVFAQATDAIHFANISDSLALVYPDSKYVRALRAEADRRKASLELQTRLNTAQEIGYPDIELPDVNAKKIKLSEVDAKVVMLYFWSAENAAQKMFNLDMLKALHEDYNSKGFEIYQVSLDADKALWARVVKQQDLPWINVCDSRGAASPYIGMYNIPALPAVFMISDGELVDGQVVNEKSVRRLLDRLLK